MENEPNAIRVVAIPPLNTIKETGEIFRKTSAKSIYDLLESGDLKSVVIGGRRLVTGESIVKLMRAAEQPVYQPTKDSPRRRQKLAA